jgi:hypothetical protein
MKRLENPQDKSSTSACLIEQMRTESIRTTVISWGINNARTFVKFELKHVEAER